MSWPSKRSAAPPPEACTCPCSKQNATPDEDSLDPIRRKPGYSLQLLGVNLLNIAGHLMGWTIVKDEQGFKNAAPHTFAGCYFAGGPIVHLLNGRPSRAGASLGVRLLAPLALGLVGGAAGAGPSALAVGAAGGIVIDAVLLRRGDHVRVPTASRYPVPSPWVAHTARAAGANLGWVF